MRHGKRILLATFGTLGDIYPFIAIAHALRRRGLDVVIAAPEMHRGSIEREGIAYARLRPHENDIVQALGVDLAGAFRIMLKNPYFILDEIYLRFLAATYEDALVAAEGADAIVTHNLLVGANLAAERLGLPTARVALAPLYVQSAAAPSLTPPAPYILRPRSRWAITFNEMVRFVIRTGVNMRMKRFHAFRTKLGLPRSREDFFLDFGRKNSASKIFGLYSPRFAPRPTDGPANMEIPGFPFYEPRDERRRGLDEALRRFLSSGSAPIVFTLGSFAPQVSGNFYDVSIDAARALRRRAVLLAGPKDAERLSAAVGADEFVCCEAPHDELFPFAACVVHHGGIGTTAQALRSGKPQLIVPFFGDQPDHGERIARLRLGQALKLSSYDLQSATRALAELCDDGYICAARDFALSMRAEQGVEAVANWAEDALGLDHAECESAAAPYCGRV
ncbi:MULTISPECIES: glycosyltransferase [Methylosinus]|uniref:Glycosyltransferase n=1 Tax=Methylosinus trichosporium (strain ATCC 35070 / NCIMB 11131 / UNIQEM 75 / OB3b) TaxID=595536 RepID=A0A2D2D3Y3_METT3|nr:MULTISPECIES: glycosyltransferase [Methylosinus]ATQ69721.1 glycosyltransferase [Methylosinus trichosporium OB3b]